MVLELRTPAQFLLVEFFSPTWFFYESVHPQLNCFLQALFRIESEVAQMCPTLSDLMDCSPPGSSVHEIFQARVLEWVAIAFSLVSASLAKKGVKRGGRYLVSVSCSLRR